MGGHLIVKSNNKLYEVHIAPVKFAQMYEATVQKGDAIEIVGVKTKFRHVDAILPREITYGNYNLVLRDEKGKPFW
jgi:hypothetical protein